MIKIKIIFLPFLSIFIIIVATLTALRWLLDVYLGIISINVKVLDFYIPIVVAGISVVIFMRKRLRILDFKNSYISSTYMMLFMVVAIVFSACFSQRIVSSALYDLVELSKIDSISSVDNQTFFTFKHYDVEAEKAVYGIDYKVSGTRNNDLTMVLYIAVPFQSKVNAWYGVSFYKRISNHLNDKEKKAELDIFIRETEKKYSNYDYL